ncbi:uncharacterized protein LOC115078499 [Rhinatrema bivittatum]|uniref:uncharacterized protein LOC115078499 n=1 Tax=Rhinatrema bivittatum TaxID=194408 RepID=UPI00112602B1|nr:uncharacterized protein LOC115078499 [Rhinatrema bivittatum]
MSNMNQLLLVIVLLRALPCVLSQIVLVQPASEAVKPSETLRLPCRISGYSVSDYGTSWIRQTPDKGLAWMGIIWGGGSTDYSQSLKGRISITRDTGKNEIYLQVSGTKAEDSGTYYCARPHQGTLVTVTTGLCNKTADLKKKTENLPHKLKVKDRSAGLRGVLCKEIRRTEHCDYLEHWGAGTAVTVTTAEKSAPHLFPLISCEESPNPLILACLAKNFLPDTIQLQWSDSNNKNWTDGYRKYPSVFGSGGTYMTSSQITVPKPEGSSKASYFCEATHPALADKLKIEVPVNTAVEPKIPIVSIHPPFRDDWAESTHRGTIICAAKGFKPQAISITWLKDGKTVSSGISTEVPKKDGEGDYSIISSLELTKKDWDADTKFSCVVDHPASNTHEIKNISASLLCEAGEPQTLSVVTLRPSFEEIYDTKEAKLTCLVKNMQSSDGLNVTWYKKENGKEVELKTKVSDAQYQGSSYSASGTATVCATEWNNHNTFTCKVTHPELASQAVETLAKDKEEVPSAPSVYLFAPPSEELALKESATVICLAKHFSPKDMFMKWLKHGEEVSKESYVNTEPFRHTTATGAQVYSMYSSLTIEESEWTSGKPITCVVGHEHLPLQVIQKTIDKSSAEDEEFESLWTTASTFIVLFLLSLFYSATVTLFKLLSWLASLRDSEPWRCPIPASSPSRQPGTCASEPNPPSVFPLLPCCGDTSSTSDLTIGCLVTKYMPDDISVIFKKSSADITTGVKTFPAVYREPSYMKTSQLTISSTDWDSNTYQCFVKHPKQNKTVDLKKSDCTNQSIEPTVQVLQSIYVETPEQTKIRLVCLVTNFRPQDAKVQWLLNGEQELSRAEDFSPVQDKFHRFMGHIEVNISKEEWNKGDTYSCRVTHKNWQLIPELYNISKCSVFPNHLAIPVVYLMKPSYKELISNNKNKANITCLVFGFDLAATKVSWGINGKPIKEVKTEDPYTHPNYTQTIKSTYMVSLEQWAKDAAVTCKVKHPCLAEIQKEVTTGSRGKPVRSPVVVISKTAHQGPAEAKSITLVCDIAGFYPEDISVEWYRNGNAKVDDASYTKGPVVESQGVFSTYSILRVQRSEEKVASYMCAVHHISKKASLTDTVQNVFDFIEANEPKITVLRSSVEEGQEKLVCLADNYWPKNITIKWVVGMLQLNCSTSSTASLSNGKYLTTCDLVLTKEAFLKGRNHTCEVQYGSNRKVIQQQLQPSEYQAPVPETYLLQPSYEELFVYKKSSITFLTNALNANVIWLVDGKPTIQRVTEKKMKYANGTTWFYSSLNVTLTEWKTIKTFSCQLNYPMAASPLQLNISRQYTQLKSPNVYLYSLSSEEVSTNPVLSLICLVKDFYPEDIFVRWEKNGTEAGLPASEKADIKCNHQKQQCSTTSELLIPKSNWLMGTTYNCVVVHISSEEMVKRSTNIYTAHQAPVPDAYLLRPSFEELYVNNISAFTFLTNALNANVKWMVDGNATMQGVTEKQMKYANGTTWFYSSLNVTLTEWKTIKTFSCQLNYPMAASPLQLNISRQYTQLKSPNVYLYSLSSEEVSTNPVLSLICLVKDFYPEDIFVRWEKNGTEAGLRASEKADIKCNHQKQQCSTTSELHIPKSDWLMGTTYNCVVAHISSEEMVKRSTNIYTEKPAIADISCDYHDEASDDLSETDEDGSVWMTASTFIALFLLTLLYSSFVTFVKVK